MNPNDTQNLHLEHEVKGSHHPLCRGEGNNEGTEGSWTDNKKIYGSNEGEDAINNQSS